LDLTDEALVNSFRATKEARYFKTLVGRYQDRIYNAAFRILGNSHESEEVVQDTFIRVLQNIQTFRNQSTFAAWMFRISHNLCIDMVRTKSRKGMQVMSFDPHAHTSDDPHAVTLNVVSQIADPEPGPSQLVDSKEQQQAVVDSLEKLPESQRIVLVLHDVEGFSYEQIAEIVGANIGTVRSRIHYGRIKLRELLSPYFNPSPVVPHPR